eukprot:1781027-Pleurochrysis_carterae.AAC.1
MPGPPTFEPLSIGSKVAGSTVREKVGAVEALEYTWRCSPTPRRIGTRSVPLAGALQVVPQQRVQALRAGGRQGHQAAPEGRVGARAWGLLAPPPGPYRGLGGRGRRGPPAGRPHHRRTP